MRCYVMLVVAAAFCVAAVAAEKESGLVLHYTFDEGSGQVVRDISGYGNDGKIRGTPKWVKEKSYNALSFNGTDTYIDCGKPPSLQLSKAGTLEIWCLPKSIQGRMLSWQADRHWPGQRLVLGFVTWRDSRLLAVLADGTQAQQMREPLETGKWTHLVLTFDGANLQLYRDGSLLVWKPQSVFPDLDGVLLRIGTPSDQTTSACFHGLIGEVRVYNRALAAKQVSEHYGAGARQLDLKGALQPELSPRLYAKTDRLSVEANLKNLRPLPAGAVARIELCDAEKNVLQEKNIRIAESAEAVSADFQTRDLTAGHYLITATVENIQGNPLGETATTTWNFPKTAQVPGRKPGARILNNLVTELIDVEPQETKPYQELPFTNLRDGWVFVSSTADLQGGSVKISIDAGKEAAAIIQSAEGTRETMRHLPAGEHKLRIWCDAGARQKLPSVRRVVVRAVPAIMFCGYPCVSPAGYGTYDFEFLEKDVLPNINVIVGSGDLKYESAQKTWKERGGRWYLEHNIPTIINPPDMPRPLTGDYVYNWWTKSDGFTNPYLDGVLADEFSGGNSPDFHGYIEAVQRIAQSAELPDKAVHAWCGPMYVPSLGKDFARTVINSGYKLAWEVYLPEMPTTDATRAYLYSDVRREMDRWEKAFPGIAGHMIFTLGMFSAPPLSLDVNPQVDYKVFLDMQFNYLATAPECFGLYGVMNWKSRYSDEETIRWYARLLRHYCIEGNTDMLSKHYGYKYQLEHIENADFDNGLSAWTVSEAEPGSIRAEAFDGLGILLSRYHSPGSGNNCVRTRRCADRPNIVSQEIRNLKPEKLYSIKLIVADYGDISEGKSERKRPAMSLGIENVEIIREKSFVSDVQGRSRIGPFKGKEDAPWMNHHRLVFRAQGATAKLTLSDWADDENQGGPIGQELMYNFVEIQPYFEN